MEEDHLEPDIDVPRPMSASAADMAQYLGVDCSEEGVLAMSWVFGGLVVDIAELCRGDTSEGEIKGCEQLVCYFLYKGTVSNLVCGGT